MSDDSTLLGVVILTRHGDRQGFYQDPDSYTASGTVITPLGTVQEYQLGQKLRSLYLNASSPTDLAGMSHDVVNASQISVSADAGGEGGVIFDSAVSLMQGLFPNTTSYNTTLANGTTVVGPLGGYQYIPIESVEPDNDISLEGWTSCSAFSDWTYEFYNSSAFQQKASENADFLGQLPPYLDGRPVSLENMIFDFMNVNWIHNEEFADAVPEEYLAQARALANYHEYGVFTSPEVDGIGNIAGRTVLPIILEGFASIIDSSDPTQLVYTGVSYKPFLSLFNMTQAAEMHSNLEAIGKTMDYAASVVFEVRETSDGDHVLRFNFKNGTSEDEFTSYPILGQDGDVPLSTFIDRLAPAAINSTADWCQACGNTKDRGCAALTKAANDAIAAHSDTISPVGAGFLGAGLTIVVMLAMFGVLLFMGVLTFGRRTASRKQKETSSVDVKA
ncbi:histidine phosphatase superfamily [Schizophyllum amplum]|uniref:Histidine phosphatase superfamily n=1 Tax=Schizophyllum amplum TaxID=97359 RepID=A0A550C8Z4_9AGAR|nr:histidine phosphatase superfamily [Auriculariopsis ampla]